MVGGFGREAEQTKVGLHGLCVGLTSGFLWRRFSAHLRPDVRHRFFRSDVTHDSGWFHGFFNALNMIWKKSVLVITCHWLNVRISKKRCLSHDSMAGTSYLEVIKRVICWSCEHGRSSKWVHRCRLAYNFWMMHSNAFVVVKDNLLTFQSGHTITFNRFNRLESVQRTKVNVGRSLWQLLLIHRPPAICCREPFNFFHRPAPHIC